MHDPQRETANEHRQKLLKSAKTFLARWNGQAAELWSMPRSHRTLRVVVGDDPLEQGNLVIACVDPQWIQAPVRWASCAISICADDTGSELEYCVEDAEANVLIRCGKVELAENMRLDKLW